MFGSWLLSFHLLSRPSALPWTLVSVSLIILLISFLSTTITPHLTLVSFLFFFDVDHLKNLYWICYSIASVVYVLVFVAILAPQPGIEPCTGRGSLSYWVAREVSLFLFFLSNHSPHSKHVLVISKEFQRYKVCKNKTLFPIVSLISESEPPVFFLADNLISILSSRFSDLIESEIILSISV